MCVLSLKCFASGRCAAVFEFACLICVRCVPGPLKISYYISTEIISNTGNN